MFKPSVFCALGYSIWAHLLLIPRQPTPISGDTCSHPRIRAVADWVSSVWLPHIHLWVEYARVYLVWVRMGCRVSSSLE